MITIKTEKRFTTTDGKKHDALREAQIHELMILFGNAAATEADAVAAATLCVQQADKVMDVLTTKETSLPSARRINGGRKVRVKKEREEPSLPLT